MAVKWTSEQSEVIHSRGCSLLVAAAAGSGKTAVLTARILDRLTGEDFIDIDELLIVTFTEAAAAEMKERIRTGIEAALEADPENENLQKQSALVYGSRITTIHSFCLSVIRENFHVLDIDPGFRIVEEGENRLLMHDVMDELLEEKYTEGSESFHNFADSLVNRRDDSELEEQILRLYRFACSHPNPKEWLEQNLKMYESASPEEMEMSNWFQEQFALIKQQISEYADMMQKCLDICRSDGGPEPYIPNVQKEMAQIRQAADAESFSVFKKALSQLEFKKLKPVRSSDVDPEKKTHASDIRNRVKSGVKKMAGGVFGQTLEKQWQQVHLCEPLIREMVAMTIEFASRYEQKKREQNVIDFSDMEHLALRILTREENGIFVPSDTAGIYQKKFREIMIDEYQDSNLIQEVILTSVSRVSRGENNLFMVGDVKQSIYRFRLARPELFMEKYDSYPTKAGGNTRRIDLHRNFRSRAEVLDGVNYIFERIMRRRIGGISYDEDAKLNYSASYNESKGSEMELVAVKCDSRDAEARAAAMKIRELVGNYIVTDGDMKRPCTYGDIAVLFRSVSGWTDIFRDVFEEERIPAYVGSRTGYFQAKEIQLILHYLKLLDNPRQDFSLTAVMTSPLADFSSNEMAEIRLLDDKAPFYQCAHIYSTSGENEKIIKKLNDFYGKYNKLRSEAKWRPLHELIGRIVQENGFDAWMAARADGAQKEANIAMLVQQAVRFESTCYKGVFHFVRYMEQLETYEIDYGEAETSVEKDAVQFMSIHKSKGLEFPIVILAGMGKKFNETDLNDKILLHPDAGIGMQAIDLKLRVKQPSVAKNYIRQRMKIDNLGEEIRVLYVALTRAKEKMIMTGRYHPKKNDWFYPQSLQLGFDEILNVSSYMELLKLVVQSAASKEELPFTVRMIGEEDILDQQIGKAVSDHDRLQMLRNYFAQTNAEQAETEEQKRYIRELDEQFCYEYPHASIQKHKMKFTVSELKKQQDVLEDGSLLFAEEEVVPLLPKFLSEEEEITGASRGTVYHKVMELIDFKKEYNEDMISKEIIKFTNDGYLTEEMASRVRSKDILHFIESESGQRMQAAARRNKLHKEQPFVLGIPSSHIYGDNAEDEMILVQGIVDVYFEEDDKIIVLDYKTDRVCYGMDLKKKYEKQLDYYGVALERMLHKSVKEKIIYSFTLQEEIKW